MGENRIVTELFLDKPTFEEVSKIARALQELNIRTIVMPPEERKINTHLVVENSDLEKVRNVLDQLGVIASEKEVVLIKLENKPGTMADAATKVSNKGINLNYAFAVSMDEEMSYVLLGTSNNKKALEALE